MLKKINGFSLIGLSIVLAIVGVLAIGSVSLYSEQRIHVNWMESGTKLTAMKAALLKHAKQNKFLPCPDTDLDGFENRVSGVCSAYEGSLPYVNLGLSKADVQDAWGYAVLYAVNHGVTSSSAIIDCPRDSACFFNNTSPPAFDLTTLPLPGYAGANNLDVNSEASSGLSLGASNMIAVLVAYNENGDQTSGLSTHEAENRDGDTIFVHGIYTQEPNFFDDQTLTISANELKERFNLEMNIGSATIPNEVILGSNADSLGSDKTTGGSGHNVQTRPVDTWDFDNQNFNFGADNAGKTVTLKFDAEIIGGWEDGSRTDRYGNAHTEDQFIVGVNGTQPTDGTLDSDQVSTLLDSQQELDVFTYDDPTNNDNTGYYDNESWKEFQEYSVVLDETGQVNVNFVVGSTHTAERVNVSNVEVVLYNSPPTLPSFPGVAEVSGIPQTQGLD
jgi:hypothetical protein